jgi:tetratricopeptide (TPR) repeat protein
MFHRLNLRTIKLGFLALSLAIFASVSTAKSVNNKNNKNKVPSDQAQAEQWITDSMHRMYPIDRLDSQYLMYSSWDKQYHFGIALARVSSIQSGIIRDGYYTAQWQDYAHDGSEYMNFMSKGRSEEFAAALQFLAAHARQEIQAQQEASFQQFLPQAKAWREAAVKPAMPDAAHEHQVLAEYAFKEKDTDKAINEYTAALEVYPCWPEGQFNLATLAGEKKLFAVAVFHMKEYLELVPDSPDAQAAKDSIIIWKDKLQNVTVTANNESAAQSK